MKKIVIVTNKMIIGGIEKSLIELIMKLVNYYDITLLIKETGGTLENKIPSNVHIKKLENITFLGRFRESHLKDKIRLIISYFKLKKSKNFDEECRQLISIYPRLENSYDVAIAYGTPVSFVNYYVIYNIKASKKIIFIHNDVKHISISPLLSEQIYNMYNYIICVSNVAKDNFLSFFPYLESKVSVMYNLINIDELQRLGRLGEKCDRSEDNVLCTIGRLEVEKGQDIIPDVIRLLNKENIFVKWYLIGDGLLKDKIIEKCDEKILNQIIFKGYQENPYGFLSSCDIYIQTSRQEGFGITISEAKIFKKMILSTNFPCAYEQLDNDKTGIITEFDALSLAQNIKKLLENKSLKKYYIDNLQNFKYHNDISELISIIEEE